MAKKPTKKAAAGKPEEKKGRNKKLQLFAWVLAPLIVYVAYPLLIVALAGMVPTFVAYIIDARRERYAARTVGYMNFAGVMIVGFDIWGNNTWQQAVELISQPTNWLIMLGCAAVGWIFYFAAPPVVYAYLTVANDMKLKQLQKEQRELVREWGEQVKSTAPSLETDDAKPAGQGAAAEPSGDEADTEADGEVETPPKQAAAR